MARPARHRMGRYAGVVLLLGGVLALAGPPATAGMPVQGGGHGEESHNMRLVGFDDLQGRSAYQPVIHRQGDRWIAYVGHHGGRRVNPLTGQEEPNGTSIVDVTDPREPRYLYHIPAETGAQMAQVCDLGGRTFLLRTVDNRAHEVWDVTQPERPVRVSRIDGLDGTHKNWWECETGIAYLVGRRAGDNPKWRTNRMLMVYDLGNPHNPRWIRDFGLPGQQPGAVGPVPPGLHEPVRLGSRLYLAYGTSSDGMVQIVDRTRLLNGNPAVADPFEPTPENLVYPEVGRVVMQPSWGGHTAFPLLGVEIPDFRKNLRGRVRDFLVVPSESTANQCQEYRHMVFIIDITDETRPFGVANYQVSESSGNFCERGGRFGPHATNWSFTPLFYRKVVFVSYFNAGVRAVDVTDPYRPREVAYYIPPTNANTEPRCIMAGDQRQCKVAVQTNNVEVDDRGYIYLADRAGTGLHIVELTGEARQVAQLPLS